MKNKIKLIAELCSTPEHVVKVNLEGGKQTMPNAFMWGASKMYDALLERRNSETEESLYKSLMSRFSTMQHATEERYAKEAAKFFVWIVDSWKKEEETNRTIT